MGKFCLINPEDLEFLKEAFNILSDESRIKIICMIVKNESICVCDIVKQMGLKQNLVSHHLSVLKKIDLVETKREGKYIYYSINNEVYKKLKSLVGELFNF